MPIHYSSASKGMCRPLYENGAPALDNMYLKVNIAGAPFS